jgi:hypothetical protein
VALGVYVMCEGPYGAKRSTSSRSVQTHTLCKDLLLAIDPISKVFDFLALCMRFFLVACGLVTVERRLFLVSERFFFFNFEHFELHASDFILMYGRLR